MSKLKSSKTLNFRRFQAKRNSPLNSVHVFTYCNTGQHWFSTLFRIWLFFLAWTSLTTVFNWCFEGLGLCSNDFSKRKASDCIYQSRNRYRETSFLIFRRWLYGCAHSIYVVYVSWLCIMAMHHGYLSWLCIMAMYHGYVSWLSIMAMYHGYVSWLCTIIIYHG